MGKVVEHPMARKLAVARIMREVRVIRSLRREAKALRGYVVYPKDVERKVLALKKRKENV